MGFIRKGWLFKALLLVISVAVGVFIIEAYVRYDNRRPPLNMAEVSLGGQSYSFHDSADAFGSYDRAVVFVGDSFTAGLNCPIPSTFPSSFERRLETDREGWHAVNMGVPGYDVLEYLALVRDLISESTPAHVVVTLYLNDIEPGCTLCQYRKEMKEAAEQGGVYPSDLVERTCRSCGMNGPQQGTGQRPHAKEDPHGPIRTFHLELKKRLLSYIVLKDAVATILVKLGANLSWGQTAYPGWWDDVDGDHFQAVVAGLHLIRAELEDHGVGMTVLLYPDAAALVEENPYVPILQKAADALESRVGVTAASGYDAFLENPEASDNMFHSLADRHPNCEAHRLFGEWAYSVVQEGSSLEEVVERQATGAPTSGS